MPVPMREQVETRHDGQQKIGGAEGTEVPPLAKKKKKTILRRVVGEVCRGKKAAALQGVGEAKDDGMRCCGQVPPKEDNKAVREEGRDLGGGEMKESVWGAGKGSHHFALSNERAP